MKKASLKGPTNAGRSPVSLTSHLLRNYERELQAIGESWKTLTTLRGRNETTYQQMLRFYDELEQEIQRLEAREEAIVYKITTEGTKKPLIPAVNPLLSVSNGKKLDDLTGKYIGYWRKKLGEKRNQEHFRLPDMLRILNLKQKYPSLGAAAICSRLYPKLKKGKGRRTKRWMQITCEIQRIIEWHTKRIQGR